MNDSGCHIVDSCKYEWLDKSCESLMEGGGDFSEMAARSPLGRQVWTDGAVVRCSSVSASRCSRYWCACCQLPGRGLHGVETGLQGTSCIWEGDVATHAITTFCAFLLRESSLLFSAKMSYVCFYSTVSNMAWPQCFLVLCSTPHCALQLPRVDLV